MKQVQKSKCSLNYRTHARNPIGSFCKKKGLEKQKLCKNYYSYAIIADIVGC